MILYLLFSIHFWILINANQQYHFGVINHQTQWYFHCRQNHTEIQKPPSNDQPLISYDCSQPTSLIEILPFEIDFTFLCRSSSRLVWIIVDLYQFNTNFWLIDSKDLEIKVELNHKILVNTSKIEFRNFTNRYIIINAFYIPFESIEILSNEEIQIHIQIRNLHQLNQCQYILTDNYLWKNFLNQNSNEDQSTTFSIQNGRCDFYPTADDIPDYNVILSIKDEPPIPYYQRYLLLEEHYRQMFISLSRSAHYSTLLKLTLIFLIIILIILILFFIYMLCYHHHNRSVSI